MPREDPLQRNDMDSGDLLDRLRDMDNDDEDHPNIKRRIFPPIFSSELSGTLNPVTGLIFCACIVTFGMIHH